MIYFTLIRWGDGLFDCIRLGTDNCPVDVFVIDGGGTMVVGGRGGEGSVGLDLGSLNL